MQVSLKCWQCNFTIVQDSAGDRHASNHVLGKNALPMHVSLMQKQEFHLALMLDISKHTLIDACHAVIGKLTDAVTMLGNRGLRSITPASNLTNPKRLRVVASFLEAFWCLGLIHLFLRDALLVRGLRGEWCGNAHKLVQDKRCDAEEKTAHTLPTRLFLQN